MELPVLPLDLAALDGEGHALGLGDVDGFEVLAVATAGLDSGRMVVQRRSLGEGAAYLGNVDGDYLLFVGVVDGAEIERVLVLAVVDVRSVVHEGLLQADLVAVALIVADGPGVAVDLVHAFGGDAADSALLDHARVLADDVLDKLELFHGDLYFWSAWLFHGVSLL